MVGIALGVAVLVVVLSVMNGFERELQERILSMTAHATINGYDGPLPDWQSLRDRALENDEVVAAAPFVEGQGVLIQGERSSGAALRAVDPILEASVSRIPDLMLAGELSVLTPGSYNIILGSALAEQLGVTIGDKIIAVVAQGRVTPAGIVPRMRRFTVAGLFSAGMYEYDRGLGLIALADGQMLFQTGEEATGLRLSVADPLLAYDFARQLALSLGGPHYVTDWTRQHRNFFRSIKLTKTIMFIILLMVIGVAAFNIISTLAMVVRDKTPDIAILKTMGSRAGSISTIFAVQGTLIGLLGTSFGVLAGILLANRLTAIVRFLEDLLSIDLLAADVYFISDLPAFVNPFEVAQITVLAMVLVWIATLVPALRAARIEPAKALRHE